MKRYPSSHHTVKTKSTMMQSMTKLLRQPPQEIKMPTDIKHRTKHYKDTYRRKENIKSKTTWKARTDQLFAISRIMKPKCGKLYLLDSKKTWELKEQNL